VIIRKYEVMFSNNLSARRLGFHPAARNKTSMAIGARLVYFLNINIQPKSCESSSRYASRRLENSLPAGGSNS